MGWKPNSHGSFVHLCSVHKDTPELVQDNYGTYILGRKTVVEHVKGHRLDKERS